MPQVNGPKGDFLPHEVTEGTRSAVSNLRSFGHTNEEICGQLKINTDTLVKYYKHELDTAIVKANSEVANKLYQKATYSDDLQAQIFWLKTRARWRTADKEAETDTNKELIDELIQLRTELHDLKKRDY